MRSIREAPAHALRAVFAGIGQLLEVADKIRKQGENRAAPPAAPPARRSLDQTGNVRLLSAEDLADEPIGAGVAELEVAEPEPAGATASTADALPVPSYDSLSLPSLRARLRTLDTAQLRVLVEYEQSHAGRPDVIAMFERRIAKLAAGTPAAEG
jgi:hypothetical protein